jgi:hypothetical protein
MSCDNPTDRAGNDPTQPAEADRQIERAVLAYLIDQHPSQLTIPALSQALNEPGGDSGGNDAVERAVRELNRAGLIDCRNGRAVPTTAAIYFARLEED